MFEWEKSVQKIISDLPKTRAFNNEHREAIRLKARKHNVFEFL